jgi:hypothetical protein
MVDVESEYDEYWCSAGGMARVQRTASLYRSFREMLEFQIRKQNPDLSVGEVRIQTARRMYLSDKGTQQLLDQLESDLCTTITSVQRSSRSVPSWTD